MKITDATTHRKPYGNHQMMISKLCTYDCKRILIRTVENLNMLKKKVETNNYFYGRFRIPKFSYEIKGLQLHINMEFMFGKQLNPSRIPNGHWAQWKKIRDMVYEDMVNIDDPMAFTDFTLDNFIVRGGKPLGEGDQPWEIAYVDLEAYSGQPIPTKAFRVNKFINNEQWMEK